MAQPVRIKKMTLPDALTKYYDTVSVNKRGHQQEFSVIKRHPVAQNMME